MHNCLCLCRISYCEMVVNKNDAAETFTTSKAMAEEAAIKANKVKANFVVALKSHCCETMFGVSVTKY